jgi:hypothetical protein
MQSIDEE